MKPMRNRFVLYFRPFSWFFRNNWYSTLRWGKPGYLPGETLYLIDVGAITFGYAHEFKDNN